MIDPPGAGGSRDLLARLQRRYQHVDGGQQEEDRKQHQKKIRPAQRPAAVAGHAAVPGTGQRGLAWGDGGYGHYTSLPRRVISRRMNVAAIARMGTMNRDTQAPSGMSPPWMPSQNDQVANTCVLSMGPPA